MTGATFGGMDFDGATNSYFGGHSDAFILKVNPNGQLLWMMYLGGSDGDGGNGVAIDSGGNLLVCGFTISDDFAGRLNSLHSNDTDAFALKIDPSGTLLWMLYLGGTHTDVGNGVTVDETDNLLVAGTTRSADFDGANNQFHGITMNPTSDAFALKVSPDGVLQWMTYLGGGGNHALNQGVDRGHAIAAGTENSAFVVGLTNSDKFDGRINQPFGGAFEYEGFVLKVSPQGMVEWMRYLGGSEDDIATHLALDDFGFALVTGQTQSTDFEGRLNDYHGGLQDGFALMVDHNGNLDWMTFIGGSDYDVPEGIAAGGGFDMVVVGSSFSTDFEGLSNDPPGGQDVFAATILSTGALEEAVFLGGSDAELGLAVAVDGDDNAFITGFTESSDFEGAMNSSNGTTDAFLVKLALGEAAPIGLTDFTLVFGTLVSGALGDLLDSDDGYVRTRSQFGFSALQPNIMEILIAADASSLGGPTGTFDFDIESRVDNPGGGATVRIRNWTTNSLETIHNYGVGQTDATESISGIDATDRIRPSDGRVEMSIRHAVIATFAASGFESFFDLVEIRGE